MGASGTREYHHNLELILRVCECLRMPLKIHKIEGPSVILTFLGILLDTLQMDIRLPPENMAHLQDLLHQWRARRRYHKRALLSLICKLAHACMVITPGRIFRRRMVDTACRVRCLHHWVSLKEEFPSDIEWWVAFLPRWNGRSMMEVHTTEWQPRITFSSDASGNWGCGAAWSDHWLQSL